MSDDDLAAAADKAVEEFIALKARVTSLMGEIGKRGDEFLYPKSLWFIACSMVLVDQCVAEQAPADLIKSINDNFAYVVEAYRLNHPEPKPLNVDDPDTWPELLTETGQ